MARIPSFLGYGGFPASACISVNYQVIHGIPSPETVLKDGDIVKIDVGAFYKGYHGDCAATFAVGSVSEEAERLIRVTEASFYKGIEQALPDRRIGDIGAAIEGLRARERLYRRARFHRARRRRKAARGSRGSQLRHRRPRRAAAQRNDDCRRADGQRRHLARENAVRTAGRSKRWTAACPRITKNTICVSDNGPVILTAV